MTEKEIMEEAIKIIANEQRDTSKDAKQYQLVYLMAYNDGVLDLAERIVSKIRVQEEGAE